MRIFPADHPAAPPGGSPRQQAMHHDTVTQQALTALVSSSAQSYEQFIGGFSQLTSADVVSARSHSACAGLAEQPAREVTSVPSQDAPLVLAPMQPPRLSPPPLATASVEELEEDILYITNNPTSASRASPTTLPPTRILKMDNFVEAEDASSDEDNGSERRASPVASEYVASFSARTETTGFSSPAQTQVHGIDNGNQTSSSPEREMTGSDASPDLPNPGEVADDTSVTSSVVIVTNIRQMTYSAREAGPGEEVSHQRTDVEAFVGVDSDGEPDVVEAFSLDEDFDYDNVLLTPKFSPVEQAELKAHARRARQNKTRQAGSGTQEADLNTT